MSIPDSYLAVIKNILREKDIPFFSDEEIDFYYNKNNKNLNNTIYECLLVKAENTTLNISGLNVADSSAYFRRLATRYKPNNSGILKS